MAYSERLLQRIRSILIHYPGLDERRMFGGVCFMIDRNMCCGVSQDELMARVGADQYLSLLAEPDAREMDFTGKPMRGFLIIDAEAIEDDQRLQWWLDRCLDFVLTLPPKQPPKPKPKARGRPSA